VLTHSNIFFVSNNATDMYHLTGKESYYRPGQALKLPRFKENRHMKVAELSALRTGRLYLPRKYSCYIFLL